MRGTKARKMRKLLDISKEQYYNSNKKPIGQTDRIIIDGVDGNHRVEKRDVLRYFSSDERRLYRKLKGAYKDVNNEIRSELIADLRRQK